ncbi:uncharacterized protein Dwil_GK15481 [Drosophila willistoni]|uniref:Uncharacterized protein n=1 Tax=Drosophila willistoni TaxID=7260 RepID=B4NPC3_DROWI|nr:uncharacterized protein LOC6653124 [Drosophila willistoni]EDW86363.1 uncharacterized protein Dwil_GK15481 [Drosophila willistoni]
MPTTRCVCGPQVPYDYSLGMASRQFNKPRCPCTKCKNRAREAEIAMGKQVASNAKGGVCGQCIDGMQIGKPAMAGPGGFSQGCAIQEQRQMQPSARPHQGPRPGPEGSQINCGCSAAPGPTSGASSGRKPNQVGQVAPIHDGPLQFGGPTYGRQSISRRDGSPETSPPLSIEDDQPCIANARGHRGEKVVSQRHVGRDTLGHALDLQTSGVALMGMCTDDVECDENCGYGTGCVHGCYTRTRGSLGGVKPGGRAESRPNDMRGPVGVNIFGNEQVNCFVTFLMEMLGILVFFAICTITFWITLGYYIVQLVVDLKNADRFVQTAVAIIFCLLVLAFCITLVTTYKPGHSRSGCRNKDKCRQVQSKVVSTAKGRRGGGSCTKCTSLKPVKNVSCKKKTSTFSLMAKKAKTTTTCASGSKAKSSAKRSARPKFLTWALLKNACKRIAPRARKPIAVSPCKSSTRRYTDCQGRAIFQNSKRFAIPTEMKQPPALVVWLRDLMCRLFRR